MAAKLDSKGRLVLPLFIRETLRIEKEGLLLMEIQSDNNFVLVRFSKTRQPVRMNRNSKNGWEQ